MDGFRKLKPILNDMGLLRVLLAITVFMAHAPQAGLTYGLTGFGGSNAVEIFFLISGFYIARILDKSYYARKNFMIIAS